MEVTQKANKADGACTGSIH